MTQYLLAVHRDAVSNATITPVDVKRYFARIDEFNTEMHLSGRLVFGGRLEPSSAARAVRFEYGGTVMKCGPHLEINEHVRRLWVIAANDLDEALEWARGASAACKGSVEIRPFADGGLSRERRHTWARGPASRPASECSAGRTGSPPGHHRTSCAGQDEDHLRKNSPQRARDAELPRAAERCTHRAVSGVQRGLHRNGR